METCTRLNTYVTTGEITGAELDVIQEALCKAGSKVALGAIVSPRAVKYSLFMMNRDGNFLHCVRALATDELVGAFAFCIGNDWWTEELVVSEIFIVDIPNASMRGGIGRIAGEYMVEAARINGARFLQAGSLLSSCTAMVDNLYMNKLSFDTKFSCYYKMVNGGERE